MTLAKFQDEDGKEFTTSAENWIRYETFDAVADDGGTSVFVKSNVDLIDIFDV